MAENHGKCAPAEPSPLRNLMFHGYKYSAENARTASDLVKVLQDEKKVRKMSFSLLGDGLQQLQTDGRNDPAEVAENFGFLFNAGRAYQDKGANAVKSCTLYAAGPEEVMVTGNIYYNETGNLVTGNNGDPARYQKGADGAKWLFNLWKDKHEYTPFAGWSLNTKTHIKEELGPFSEVEEVAQECESDPAKFFQQVADEVKQLKEIPPKDRTTKLQCFHTEWDVPADAREWLLTAQGCRSDECRKQSPMHQFGRSYSYKRDIFEHTPDVNEVVATCPAESLLGITVMKEFPDAEVAKVLAQHIKGLTELNYQSNYRNADWVQKIAMFSPFSPATRGVLDEEPSEKFLAESIWTPGHIDTAKTERVRAKVLELLKADVTVEGVNTVDVLTQIAWLNAADRDHAGPGDFRSPSSFLQTPKGILLTRDGAFWALLRYDVAFPALLVVVVAYVLLVLLRGGRTKRHRTHA